MNVDKLRENKTKAISRLSKEGVSVRQIAILLYDDDSESAQKRVRALISKLRKKKLASLISRSQPQPQPQPFEQQPQPQPQPQPEEQANEQDDNDIIIEDENAEEEEREAEVIKEAETVEKEAETVEKGKAADTVLSWLDEDGLARQLADECYEKAKRCYEEKDYQNAFKFMELVTRFLRLSQTARREYDLDELKKAVVEEDES